jgi:hypothetical protein
VLLLGCIDSHEVISIALGFRKFHRIHAFSGVPVQESTPLVHGSELEQSSLPLIDMAMLQKGLTCSRVRWNTACIAVEFDSAVAAW